MIINCHPSDEADIRAYAAYLAERRRLAMELWEARKLALHERVEA